MYKSIVFILNLKEKVLKKIKKTLYVYVYIIYKPVFIHTIYITKYIKNLFTYFYNHTIFTMFTASHYVLLF